MQMIMNGLDGFFPALLRASWQAGALVLVVLAAQRLLAGRLPPRWRHALWLIVLARLLLPVSVPSPASVFNLLHVPTAPDARNEGLPPSLTSGFTAGDRGTAAQPDFSAAPAVDPSRPSAIDATPPLLEPAETASTAAAPPATTIFWTRLAAWLWLAGVVGFTAVLAVQTIVLARRLRQAVPITEEPLLRLLDACREEMGVRRRVELCETAAVQSPALCGVFRPRLLLPRGLAGRLSPAELCHVLLHELAHLKRHDLALNWLATALQVLHWFNPLVWLAGARMRADRELACDALALEAAGEAEKQAYGETILRLLEGFNHTARLPGLVGILEDKRQLRRRILAIAGFRKSTRWSALAAVLVAGLAVVGLTDAQQSRPDSSPSPTSVAGSEARQSEEPVKGQPREELRWGTLTFEGQPLANVKVRLRCQDRGVFDSMTDAEGRLRLRRGLCEDLKTVWCEKGYAEVKPGTLADGFHCELKPVGRIEGRLYLGDSPGSNEVLWLVEIPFQNPLQRLPTEMVQTSTDQTGQFIFPVVPPGRWRINWLLEDREKGKQPLNTKRDASSAFAGLGRLTCVGGFESLVQVRPGQTSRVDLGKGSRTVIGTVVPEQLERPFRWTFNSGSSEPDTNTGAERQPARQVQKEHEQADYRWLQYLPEIAADGKFTIRGVPPGDYVLNLYYVAWPEAGSATRLLEKGWAGGTVHVPVASAEPAGEPVDIGTFKVHARNQLKIGDLAPPFEVKTFDGQPVRLADFKGKVVLLCFWQDGPYPLDLEQLKDLALLRQQYRTDDRLVILGVNMNPNRAEAEAVLAKEKWDWQQTWGADQLAFFRDTYEVGGTPTLLVIGTDGRVRARYSLVEGIRLALAQTVNGRPDLNPGDSAVGCRVNGVSVDFSKKVRVVYTAKDGLDIFGSGGDRSAMLHLSVRIPSLHTGTFSLEDTPGIALEYSSNVFSSDSASYYGAPMGSIGGLEVNIIDAGAVGERVNGTFSAEVANDRGEKLSLTAGYFSAIRQEPIPASNAPAPRR